MNGKSYDVELMFGFAAANDLVGPSGGKADLS